MSITTINLVRPESSEVSYKILELPDGQQDIIINPDNIFYKNNCYLIKSRFNNFRDLELILCATKALRNQGVNHVALYIPYLLGARSDRKFQEGGTSYLRDIIAPILNAQNYEYVKCLDVHSNVAEAVISNLIVVDNSKLVEWAIGDINSKDYVLVAPDAGAQHKIFNLAQKIGYKGEIITCSKERDLTTGKIISTSVPYYIDHYNKDLIIIDDICDGGRTFIEIAKTIEEIKNAYEDKPTTKLYLIVTHGIFSKGFADLYKDFSEVYCTNSYIDIENERILKQQKVI